MKILILIFFIMKKCIAQIWKQNRATGRETNSKQSFEV